MYNYLSRPWNSLSVAECSGLKSALWRKVRLWVFLSIALTSFHTFRPSAEMQPPSAAAQPPLQRTGRVCFLGLTPVLVLNACIQKGAGAGVSSGSRWMRRFSWKVFSATLPDVSVFASDPPQTGSADTAPRCLAPFPAAPTFHSCTRCQAAALPFTVSLQFIPHLEWTDLLLKQAALDQIIQSSAASEMPAVNSCSNDGNNNTSIFDILVILLIHASRSSWTEGGSSTSPSSWRWLKRTSCFSSRCRGAESPGP